jgi:hypothetical protein
MTKMTNDDPTGTINIETGLPSGDFVDGSPFLFTVTTPVDLDVTINGMNAHNLAYAWFTDNVNPPGSTVIPAGDLSVQVTAIEVNTAQDPWFTYTVTDLVCPTNVHVVVSDSLHTHKKKAS